MTLQKINLGAAPNDKTGTPFRSGGTLINTNFDEVANTRTVMHIGQPEFDGGRVLDGRIVAGATTTATTATTVTLPTGHGIVAADIGKWGWVLDDGGNGSLRQITAVGATSITLNGTVGRVVTSRQFVYGTPIDAALVALLAAAGARTSVDATAGVNRSWGPNSAVTAHVGGGTGIAILTSAVSIPRGVRLDAPAMIYCGGVVTSTPYFTFASSTSIGKMMIDVGPGRGIVMGDDFAAQAHCTWEDIEIWNRGAVTGSHLIELRGLDFQGRRIWTKGGDSAVRGVSATDSDLGHIFAIGAKTALALSAASQVKGHVFSDSCTVSLRMWGGCNNIDIDVQAFMTSASASGTTKIVTFYEKDDTPATTSTAINSDINIDFQATDTGNAVVTLNYVANSRIRGLVTPRLSSGAYVASTRGQMTGVVYGAGVGDGIDIDIAFPPLETMLSDGVTPLISLFSGTRKGNYVARYAHSGVSRVVHVWGAPFLMSGGTSTVPTYTAL